MNSYMPLIPENQNSNPKIYGFNLRDQNKFYANYFEEQPKKIKKIKKKVKLSKSARISIPIRLSEIYNEKKLKHFADYNRNDNIPFYKKCIIPSDSKIKALFDFIVLILVNYSSLIIFYDFTFRRYDNFIHSFFYYAVEFLFSIYILLQFFTEYQDDKTLELVSSIKEIALHYIKQWFIFDLVSTIPFEIFTENYVALIKLIRLVRLPKLVQTIQMKRFDRLVSSFYTKRNKHDNVNKGLVFLFNIRCLFKILRLLISAFIFSYIIGCLWYIVCLYIYQTYEEGGKQNTFVYQYIINKKTNFEKLLTCVYFAMTMLTTVGFGDSVPQNKYEKYFALVLFVLGVGLFSYVMSSFKEQLTVYNETFHDDNKEYLLQNWLDLLNKYNLKCPFKSELIKKIEKDFKYFWKNDRINDIDKSKGMLSKLPCDIKMQITDFLWQNVFFLFSPFFMYKSHRIKYHCYYYELSFLLLPRYFDKRELIYIVNREVEEIYFILNGTVNISYTYDYVDRVVHHRIYSRDFFGGYYALYNVTSEYNYRSATESKMYAINKFDLLKLNRRFPFIGNKMRRYCYYKYRDFVKNFVDAGIAAEMDKKNRKGFYLREMVGIEDNINGLLINRELQEDIAYKEMKIEMIKKNVKEKFKKVKDKSNKSFLNICDSTEKYNNKFNLFNKKKNKVKRDYSEWDS